MRSTSGGCCLRLFNKSWEVKEHAAYAYFWQRSFRKQQLKDQLKAFVHLRFVSSAQQSGLTSHYSADSQARCPSPALQTPYICAHFFCSNRFQRSAGEGQRAWESALQTPYVCAHFFCSNSFQRMTAFKMDIRKVMLATWSANFDS
jgi:hypothetical protein